STDRGIDGGGGARSTADQRDHTGRVFTAGLGRSTHSIVVIGLVGDDDQGQHHVHGATAHAEPLGHERLGDLRRGGARKVERHRGLPVVLWLVTVVSTGVRPGRAGLRRRTVPRYPTRTAPACRSWPRTPGRGPGCARTIRPPPDEGTTVGHR